MRNITFRTENIITEHVKPILIHAKADCQDKRTGSIVPLTFFYIKNIDPRDVNSDEVKSLINLTVMDLGFEFVRLEFFDSETVYIDAEKTWKEEHEQKSFAF